MASHKCCAIIVSALSMFVVAGSALAQNTAPAVPTKIDPAKVQPAKIIKDAKDAVKDATKGGQPDMQGMQEMMMKAAAPGENHKRLEAFVGEWDGTVKHWMDPASTPMESATSVVAKMEMDGRYLYSHYTGEMGGQKFKGHGVVGYNNITKEYEASWLDNMSTGVEASTGKLSADGKEFTFTGMMTDPTAGKKVNYREVMKWTSADSYTQEFFMTGPDGKESKGMEITLQRKGSAVKAIKDEVKDKIKGAVNKLPAAPGLLPPKK